ncbi:MAG: hypothetical protein ACD_12C00259G0005 [uncultured bacterium]|nr:MAG: hypothetical protein ACD_12C00259G0005 [uncultured bacterium]
MISTNLFLFSKKIHRFLVIFIAIIGIIMSVTGILLKYTFIAAKFTFIDLELIRFIHNNLSPIFALVFLGMLITGLIMYIFPLIRKN